METFGVIFAGIGAALILGALTFVTLLIGGLVNAMVVLTAGEWIDRWARKRGLPVWEPEPSSNS
ncbi:MAG TPA: hypothetical protein VNK43_13675 [Gemmatimonadales bacterium]|nr:hypothetical protein [Gemmatimonadales bacterium]